MSPVGPRRTAGHERPLRATRNRPLRGRREKVGIDGRVLCSLRSRRFRVPLQAVFVSAERSCPKGGGQAARGGRPAVQAGAPRRTPIAARRSTATAAFVVARKRTMRCANVANCQYQCCQLEIGNWDWQQWQHLTRSRASAQCGRDVRSPRFLTAAAMAKAVAAVSLAALVKSSIVKDQNPEGLVGRAANSVPLNARNHMPPQ